eukprot:GEMP01063574.1.p1 GENE.GEMP01063574.1~~GEMP01063574.1.p1  ORF type:complete len:249 (+),score=59.47 GEMP01063574.1:324-1070(+)
MRRDSANGIRSHHPGGLHKAKRERMQLEREANSALNRLAVLQREEHRTHAVLQKLDAQSRQTLSSPRATDDKWNRTQVARLNRQMEDASLRENAARMRRDAQEKKDHKERALVETRAQRARDRMIEKTCLQQTRMRADAEDYERNIRMAQLVALEKTYAQEKVQQLHSDRARETQQNYLDQLEAEENAKQLLALSLGHVRDEEEIIWDKLEQLEQERKEALGRLDCCEQARGEFRLFRTPREATRDIG